MASTNQVDPEQLREVQRNHIRSCLPNLIQWTTLNSLTFSVLTQRRVLGPGDVAELKSIPNDHARNMEFYKIIQTRLNFYEVLLEAMKVTEQTGVLDLLSRLDDTESVKKCRSSWNPRKYFKLPQGFQEFLDSPKQKICIVPTLDINITLEKIRENLEGHCAIHECLTEFLRQICPQTTSSMHTNSSTCQAVPVADFAELKNIVDDTLKVDTFKKLLLVTPQENHQFLQDHPHKFPSWTEAVEVIHDSMEWDDLSPAYKQHVRSRVKEKFRVDFEQELDELFRGEVLVQLINGNELRLFKWTIPKQLDYYIERKIITRNVISDNIFSQKKDGSQPHTFLLTGMKRSELSFLAKDQVTGSTREQLGQTEVAAKFMIQDKPIHFDWICTALEGTGDNPAEPAAAQSVHLLHRDEDKRWRWQKSVGEMGGVHPFIDPVQDILSEDEFIQNLRSDINLPVCISDSPGMGKSVLLGQMARKLIQLHPDRDIIFLNIVHFIHQVNQNGAADPAAVLKAVQSLICENGLAREVLKLKFTSADKITIELLLDGFDELETANYGFAKDIICKTMSSFKSVRLWVTSRRHFLTELEETLTILGYMICPFSEEDQMQFLMTYWTSNNKNLDQVKLQTFSRKCLKKIKSGFSSTDRDIAGIPLQCRLIAEVYEKAATDFSEIGRTSATAEATFKIRSIQQLFEQTIENRFTKYEETNDEEKLSRDEVMQSHARTALEFLFPEYYKQLSSLFKPQLWKEVLKVGILESSSNLEETPHFVHRTYAEYFTAWWLVNMLSSEHSLDHSLKMSSSSAATPTHIRQRLSDFLFQEVMHIQIESGIDGIKLIGTGSRVIWPEHSIQMCERCNFTHNVITHFLNSLLTKACLDVIPARFSNNFAKLNIARNTGMELAYASANSDFLQIFKFLIKLNSFDKKYGIFSFDFLHHAIISSGFEFVELALQQVEEYRPFDRATEMETLRKCTRRGDFSILELFLNRKHLHKHVGELPGLLHDCVEQTKNNSDREIKQRITICETLLMHNVLALQEITEGRTPLLGWNVHIRLMITLIELGADVLARDEMGDTMLHLNCNAYSIQLTIQEYESLLRHIPQEKLKRLSIIKGEDGDIPLVRLLKHIDPSHFILQRFQEADFNFNYFGGDNLSILAIAIKSGRSRETLQNLIEMGAQTEYKIEQKTLLHLSVESGNVEAVQILLERGMLDVNAKDEDGLTALDYAVRRTECVNRFKTGRLLHGGGGIIKEMLRDDGISWLHVYAARGEYDSLHLLLHYNIPVNGQDDEGNTPLHFGVKECEARQHNYYDITNLLLEHGSDPNLSNKLNETPFHVALNNKYLDLETYNLLKSKMDMKWTSLLATSSLRFAMRTANCLDEDEFYSILRDCVEDGADINCQGAHLNTPLHVAVDKKQLKVVQLLVQKNAHINVRNAPLQLQTPLHRAALHCSDEAGLQIVKYLIGKGADVNLRDSKDRTFLHVFAGGISFDPKILPQLISIVDFLIERNLRKLFDPAFIQMVEGLEDTETTGPLLDRIRPNLSGQTIKLNTNMQGSPAKFENIVVGSRDCTVSMVVRSLHVEDNLNLVLGKWSDIARELGMSSGSIRKSRNEHILEKLSPTDMIHEVIEEWVTREANAATLQRLAHAFDVVGLAACADLLRNMTTHTIAYRKLRDL